jgi:thiamine biosynthesis lipoprotein
LLAGCGHALPIAKAKAERDDSERLVQLDDIPFFERWAVRMGTEVQIVIPMADPIDSGPRVGRLSRTGTRGPERERAEEAAEAALAEIARIEDLMTDWRDDSQLEAINRGAGKAPVKVDRELLEVLEASKRVSEITGGVFDVTYASVGRYWDFKSDHPSLPDRDLIARALPRVGYKKLIIDFEAGTAFLSEEGMRIGLGGIAKGYAVQRASDLIKSKGIDDFAIKAGGDMSVRGLWNGKPWKIGIRDPRDRQATVAILPVSNVAISTSGDYERFFMLDGKRYAHIIDPGTGYPVMHTQSATVIARDCTLSDGLSKGAYVVGGEEGLSLVTRVPGVEAVIIDGEGRMHVSKGLAAANR